MAGVAVRVCRSICASSTTLWHQAWCQLRSTIAAIACQSVRLLLLQLLGLRIRLILPWLIHAADASGEMLAEMHVLWVQWMC
jgi:hypothetical protein